MVEWLIVVDRGRRHHHHLIRHLHHSFYSFVVSFSVRFGCHDHQTNNLTDRLWFDCLSLNTHPLLNLISYTNDFEHR